jgi:hypothetical protein
VSRFVHYFRIVSPVVPFLGLSLIVIVIVHLPGPDDPISNLSGSSIRFMDLRLLLGITPFAPPGYKWRIDCGNKLYHPGDNRARPQFSFLTLPNWHIA